MNIPPSQQLMDEILWATEKLQMEFPANYRYLSETPLFLFGHENSINQLDFEHYLESLLMQLKTFKKASPMPVNM
ncbi:MAG: hypothetical protein IPN76_28070 [Saprospiraceae bacterium]|nr:hypothetical protein [Saprospiraceae bacterium]